MSVSVSEALLLSLWCHAGCKVSPRRNHWFVHVLPRTALSATRYQPSSRISLIVVNVFSWSFEYWFFLLLGKCRHWDFAYRFRFLFCHEHSRSCWIWYTWGMLIFCGTHLSVLEYDNWQCDVQMTLEVSGPWNFIFYWWMMRSEWVKHRIRKKREWRKLQKLVCARVYVLMTGSHITSVNKWCVVSLSIAYCEYNCETLLRGGLQKCELCSRSRLVLSQVSSSVVFMFVYPLHVTYWARLAVPWPTGRICLTAFVVFFSKSIDWSGFSSVWSGMYDVDV